jgi:hypothetical protein
MFRPAIGLRPIICKTAQLINAGERHFSVSEIKKPLVSVCFVRVHVAIGRLGPQ